MTKHLTYFAERRKWHPLVMSLVSHTLLALLLILLWSFSDRENQPQVELRRASIVLADSLESQPNYLAEADVQKKLDSPTPQTDFSANPDSPPPLNIEATKLPNRPGFLPAESLVSDANRMSIVPTASVAKTEFQLSPDDIKMIEADRRLLASRIPIGEPATISVFGGGNLTGRDFVFVLDRSQSMGTNGLGVIDASRTELTAAIGQLEQNHNFQIVAYHDQTVTMSTRKLLPANAANKSKVSEFIANLSAFGGTHHENGLVAALAFHPDVIVLLTDGGEPGLHDGQLKFIHQLAGDKTQIHCIQFNAGPLQASTNFMTRLAAQNNGSFRYIDVKEW